MRVKIGLSLGIIIGSVISSYTFSNGEDSTVSCFYMLWGLYMPEIFNFIMKFRIRYEKQD